MLPCMRVVLLVFALSACGQDPEPCAWQDIETNLEYGEASFPDGRPRGLDVDARVRARRRVGPWPRFDTACSAGAPAALCRGMRAS